MLNAELDGILRSLITEWNIAERRIKKAEQVRGGEVVTSAIFELRYAGRKIIDAFALALNGDWSTDLHRYGQIREQLDDAIEDCVKAKHDAIDAMLTFVTYWFDKIEKELGVNALIELFPDYMDLTTRIAGLQEKIAESRGDRNEGRHVIYDEIERSGFDDILSLYERMLHSRDRVTQLVRAKRRKQFCEFWGIVIAAVATVLLLLFEILRYFVLEP